MHKDSASRTQWQKNPLFFIDIVETKPILPEQSEGTIVQVEHNGKKNHFFFIDIVEMQDFAGSWGGLRMGGCVVNSMSQCLTVLRMGNLNKFLFGGLVGRD